ncbi:MAG: heme o synthase [Gloeobacterales cyanobacterium]
MNKFSSLSTTTEVPTAQVTTAQVSALPSSAPSKIGATVADYIQLTKPRIIVLLLITTAGAMWIAGEGVVPWYQLMLTLLGGTLASASANTFNCVVDRDIDYIMERTRSRPLPSGRIQPYQAITFGSILGVLSFTLLAVFINPLSAWLALSGILFYVFVYTLGLKRTSTQNIVIGGAAGAIPPLVGWAAITGDLSPSAWVLFGIIFLWTPPHFWALALMLRDDYRKAGVPMLPVVKGTEETVKQILLYTWLMVPVTLLLYPLGTMGLFYAVSASILGVLFIVRSWRLLSFPDDKQEARVVFKFSILYLMLLFAAMAVDSIMRLFM